MNTNCELRAIVENICRNLSTGKVPCKPNHVTLSFGCVDGEWGWGLVIEQAGHASNKSKGFRPRLNGWGETPSKAIDDALMSPAFERWQKDLSKGR